jgi:hypothetical protein
MTATPVGDWIRRRYPPNDGATHYLGTGPGDPGCCGGGHPACLYDAAFCEGALTERERIGLLTDKLAAGWAAQGSELAERAADSAERGALPERTESVAAQSRTLGTCARALVVLAEVIRGNAGPAGGDQ